MQRNRYLLSLLVCGYLLYYAVPRLSVTAPGARGLFAIAWLVLALFAAAGNLSGILYYPKQKTQRINQNPSHGNRKKSRSFY